MHTEDLSRWTHTHDFNPHGQEQKKAERGTRLVLALTVAAMLLEIGAGWWTGSMALLADGWHMSSHVLAIGLSAFAYAAARRLAKDTRFAFGTWKIEVLAGFASAILLAGVAALMVAGSLERLLAPQPIRYAEAIAVALLGLAVNVASAFRSGTFELFERVRMKFGVKNLRCHRHGSRSEVLNLFEMKVLLLCFNS